MEKATEHAKEAAKHLGSAISEKSQELTEQWKEANKDRHDVPVQQDGPSIPTHDVNMDELKKDYETAKEKTVEAYQQAKEYTLQKTEEASEKVREWNQNN